MSPPFFPPAHSGAPWLRLDVWEKGNISIVQLEEKLRGAARQALADAIMELRLLPASLCTEDASPGTWHPGNVPGPGETVSLVRWQRRGSRKASQRHPPKYTFTVVLYLLCVRKVTCWQKCTRAVVPPLREGHLLRSSLHTNT